SEAAACFDQPDAHTVARQSAAHEDDVPVRASDALAAECKIVDRELERVAAARFRHGPRHYKRRSETSQFGGEFAVYHTDVMRSATPRAVADVLAAAVPQIAERIPEYRIRTAWRALVGVDVARRTRPQAPTNGCLHGVVGNSPRLPQVTPRATQPTDRLHPQCRAGPAA